jgi:hypothetical protein
LHDALAAGFQLPVWSRRQPSESLGTLQGLTLQQSPGDDLSNGLSNAGAIGTKTPWYCSCCCCCHRCAMHQCDEALHQTDPFKLMGMSVSNIAEYMGCRRNAECDLAKFLAKLHKKRRFDFHPDKHSDPHKASCNDAFVLVDECAAALQHRDHGAERWTSARSARMEAMRPAPSSTSRPTTGAPPRPTSSRSRPTRPPGAPPTATSSTRARPTRTTYGAPPRHTPNRTRPTHDAPPHRHREDSYLRQHAIAVCDMALASLTAMRGYAAKSPYLDLQSAHVLLQIGQAVHEHVDPATLPMMLLHDITITEAEFEYSFRQSNNGKSLHDVYMSNKRFASHKINLNFTQAKLCRTLVEKWKAYVMTLRLRLMTGRV